MRSSAESPAPSPELRAFVEESVDRPAIFRFVAEAARRTPPGSRVLDAGSGSAPYRELFADCDYTTADWAHSIHDAAQEADVVASLVELPFEDSSFDAVLNTQVLEHVAEPAEVLRELHRILAPAGKLWLTAPLVWELHEEPYDFLRFTPHGLRFLLERAGFTRVEIQPLGSYYTTLAHLLHMCGPITGAGGGSLTGRLLAALLRLLAPLARRLDRLDRRRALPLGYGCVAVRPGDPVV